jgi:hypothetical protein
LNITSTYILILGISKSFIIEKVKALIRMHRDVKGDVHAECA